MNPPTSLDERVARLERELAELGERLGALERGAVREARGAPPPAGGEAPRVEAAPALLGERWRGIPALVGRTCLALGGAFIFRSLTEAATLTAAVGVGLGVGYALVWLYLADRAAARGLHLSGAFHALVSALILFPLLFEATTRFALLSPEVAALALAAVSAAGLGVAWRRSFRTVAWITEVAALGVAVLLLFRSRAVLAFTVYLLALAVASLLLAYGRGWRGQRWLVALSLDGVVLLLGALRLVGAHPPEWLRPGDVMIAQLGLAIVYLGAFVLRLLFQGRGVTAFAITQTVLVSLVGFEGALRLAPPEAGRAIAIMALLFAVVLHVVLARRSEQRWGHGVAVGYFASLATYLAAEAARVLLPGTVYPAVWALAATVVAVLALRGARPILQVHAALLAVGAVATSGLGAAALNALAAPAARFAGRWGVELAGVLVLLVATAVLLDRAGREVEASQAAFGSRLTTLVFSLVGVGAWLVTLLAPMVATTVDGGVNAGRLAVLRSAVLAVAAVGLAAGRAAGARSEWGRLVAVVLILAGIKLLVEDLRVGSAGSLVFSLVLYGSALLVAPALARRGAGKAAEAEASSPMS